MPKFSIIVPLYNVEKYISQCIESVLNQTYTDFELLLVDDKSVDRSLDIAKEFAKKDSRIKIIEKEHGGLPHTRNYGLRAAEGEYIVLLDADDYFSNYHLEKTSRILDMYNCEMCIANNHINFTDAGEEKIILFDYKDELNELPLEDCLNVIFDVRNRLPAAAVLTVYKRDFLIKNNINYEETYTCSEDLDIFLHSIAYVNNIKFIGHDFYYYRQDNIGAMTKNMSGNKYFSRMQVYKKWYDYYTNRSIGDFNCEKIMHVLKKDFVANIYGITHLPQDDIDKKRLIEFLKENMYIWNDSISKFELCRMIIKSNIKNILKKLGVIK